MIIDNKCINKRADLYLDYTKKEYLILSQTNIKKHIRRFKEDGTKVFMTFINNRPFFIFSKDEKAVLMRKTDLKIDLSEYLKISDYSIQDFSYWILKEYDGKLEVVNEVLFGCN